MSSSIPWLQSSPCIMGIVNCSPDSFHAANAVAETAIRQAEAMVAAGATLLDVGGEATNPSLSIAASTQEKALLQCERVLPVIEAIKQRFDVAVSVDTSEPLVMQESIRLGVDCINDQRSLFYPGAADVVIAADIPVILMHSYLAVACGDRSVDIVERVQREWLQQFDQLVEQGLKPERVILDPGFGQGNFGKDCAENYRLLAHLPQLVKLGFPVLVGWSRKSMVRDVSHGAPPEQLLPGSLAAAVYAVQKGASILRVHDVAETVQAMAVLEALQRAEVG